MVGWKVLGTPTPLVKAGRVFRDRLVELSRRKKGRTRFMELMERGEVNYWFDGSRNVHAFYIEFQPSVGPDDIAFLKEFILKVIGSSADPVVELNGEAQRFSVVLTSEEEEDPYGRR